MNNREKAEFHIASRQVTYSLVEELDVLTQLLDNNDKEQRQEDVKQLSILMLKHGFSPCHEDTISGLLENMNWEVENLKRKERQICAHDTREWLLQAELEIEADAIERVCLNTTGEKNA